MRAGMLRLLMPEMIVERLNLGLFGDVPPHEIPKGGLSDMLNFRVQYGFAAKLKGYQNFYTGAALSGIPVGLFQYPQITGNPKIVLHTTTKYYEVVNATTVTDRTGALPMTGTRDNLPHSALWTPSNTFLITNFADPPRKWTGSGDFANIAGSPPKMKLMFVWFTHLLGLYTNNGSGDEPFTARWSKSGNFEVWTGDPSAGSLTISTAKSPIQGAIQIGPYIVVCTLNTVHVLQYVGEPIYVAERPILAEVGCVGPHAIASDGNNGYFIGEEDIYVTNAVSVTAIGGRVRRELFQNINMNNRHRSILFYDEENREMHAIVPFGTSTEPNYHYSWSIAERIVSGKSVKAVAAVTQRLDANAPQWNQLIGPWTDQSFGWFSRFFTGNFPIKFVAQNVSPLKLTDMERGETDETNDWDGWVQGPLEVLQSAAEIEQTGILYKVVSQIELLASKVSAQTADFDIEISLGTADREDDPLTFGQIKTINTSQLPRLIVDFDPVKAKFFIVRMRSAKKDQPLRVYGYRIKWQRGGRI